MPFRTKFRIPPTGVLAVLEEETAGRGRVELDNAIFAGGDDWFEYLTVVADIDIAESTLSARRLVKQVDSETSTSSVTTQNFLTLAEEPAPFVVTTLTRNRAVPHRIFLEDGSVTVVAWVQDWTHLKELADDIEVTHAGFELLQTTQVDGIGYPLGSEHLQFGIIGSLSENQLQALKVAYEMGFFEVPQEVNGKEVAAQLGISQSAVSEKLRRAHHNLCKFLFGKRPAEPRLSTARK